MSESDTTERARDLPADLGPLPDYLGYALRRAQVAMFRDFERRMAALNATPGQFSLLTVIAANPGISQRELAALHRLDKSTLSPAVERLTKRGLVVRERDPADRRYYALTLTGAGKTLLEQLTSLVEGQERTMAGAIPSGDVTRLINDLRGLARALDPPPRPGSTG